MNFARMLRTADGSHTTVTEITDRGYFERICASRLVTQRSRVGPRHQTATRLAGVGPGIDQGGAPHACQSTGNAGSDHGSDVPPATNQRKPFSQRIAISDSLLGVRDVPAPLQINQAASAVRETEIGGPFSAGAVEAADAACFESPSRQCNTDWAAGRPPAAHPLAQHARPSVSASLSPDTSRLAAGVLRTWAHPAQDEFDASVCHG